MARTKNTPACPYAVCEEKLAALNEKMDQVITSVIGNGKPGLILRVDRLEQAGGLRSRIGNAGAYLAFSGLVGTLVAVLSHYLGK